MADAPHALDLLRSVGLTPDGPVLWGAPAGSRAPGVFLVELAAPVASAPIDHARLRAWIERVPTLLVDGARPTPAALAARMAAFWLPDQTLLYVGRSAKALSGRIAALYATPLGDRRPHAGGHWLKALRGMERLRIWWAETDAPEETEDAILDAIAASVEAGSRDRHGGRVLPWANLEAVTGERRDTGITGALRADVGAEVGAGATGSVGGSEGQRQVRTIAGPRPSAAPRAAAGAPRAAAARVRGSRAAGPCSPPPSVHLTAEGLAAATAELEELRNVRRPEVIQRVKHARELGDLRENADYEAARNEQSFLEGRIRTLERLLKAAVVIDTAGDGKVALGSTVVVEVDGERQTLRIVGSAEADPVSGRISNVSPVGRQLLGRRPGEEVVIRTPGHEVHYRVIEVDGTAA